MVGSPSNRYETSREAGMTLLEIMFSVALLLLMTVSASSIIRNGIDMRIALSQQSKVNHRLNLAMQKLADDIEETFLIDLQRQELLSTERSTKSIFAIKMSQNSSELRMTTLTHKAIEANSHESDQSLVVYKVEKDNNTGRTHLMRGDSEVIPTQLDEDPPMTILARNIKAIRVTAWNGDDWKDEWNSTRSDWRNTLPRMVRIEVEAYAIEPEDEAAPIVESDPTVILRTQVFLPRSLQTRELKEPSKSAKYEAL